MVDGGDCLEQRLTWMEASERILGPVLPPVLFVDLVVAIVAFGVTIGTRFPAVEFGVAGILYAPWYLAELARRPRGSQSRPRSGPRVRWVAYGLLVVLIGEVLVCTVGIVPRHHWSSVLEIDAYLALFATAVTMYRDIDRRRSDPALRLAPSLPPRQDSFIQAMRHKHP